jgi:hypothetical protein
MLKILGEVLLLPCRLVILCAVLPLLLIVAARGLDQLPPGGTPERRPARRRQLPPELRRQRLMSR